MDNYMDMASQDIEIKPVPPAGTTSARMEYLERWTLGVGWAGNYDEKRGEDDESKGDTSQEG